MVMELFGWPFDCVQTIFDVKYTYAMPLLRVQKVQRKKTLMES